jgi:hypothetical protein
MSASKSAAKWLRSHLLMQGQFQQRESRCAYRVLVFRGVGLGAFC